MGAPSHGWQLAVYRLFIGRKCGWSVPAIGISLSVTGIDRAHLFRLIRSFADHRDRISAQTRLISARPGMYLPFGCRPKCIGSA